MMTEDERYLFDLTGYLVIKDVLTDEEVERCNAAIDHHFDQAKEIDRSLSGNSKTLSGTSRRIDLGGMLAWETSVVRNRFRQFLIHPRIKPYLDGIFGRRLSARSRTGDDCDGSREQKVARLHGGGIERPNFSEAYFFKDGRIYTGLTVVEYMLADEGPGDGGLAVISGQS